MTSHVLRSASPLKYLQPKTFHMCWKSEICGQNNFYCPDVATYPLMCQQIVVSILQPVWLCALSSRQSSKAQETMAWTFRIHLGLTWPAFIQSGLNWRSWLSCCQQKASTNVNSTHLILMIGRKQWDILFFHHSQGKYWFWHCQY